MKQIVVCLVAVLICFSIVGCEIINSFIDSIPTPTPSASSTPTPTPTPTEEEFRIIEIKEVDYLLLGRTEWNSYEYDEDGYMVKQNHFDYYGGLIGYTTYEYDERGNLTKESYYELGGWYWDTTRDTVYEYDPDGNLVRISTYTGYRPHSWKNIR